MASTELVSLDDVERALLTGEDLAYVDPAEVSADIVRRILAAESLEDAFQSYEATPAEDVADELVTVTGIAWMRSTFNEGPPVYALMQVQRMDDGPPIVVSIGGRSVLAGLLWAMRNDAMPLKGTFRRRQSKSNEGKSYWTFQLAPKPVGK